MKKKIGRAPRAARSAAQIPTCRKRPDAIKLLEHVRGGFRTYSTSTFMLCLYFCLLSTAVHQFPISKCGFRGSLSTPREYAFRAPGPLGIESHTPWG